MVTEDIGDVYIDESEHGTTIYQVKGESFSVTSYEGYKKCNKCFNGKSNIHRKLLVNVSNVKLWSNSLNVSKALMNVLIETEDGTKVLLKLVGDILKAAKASTFENIVNKIFNSPAATFEVKGT
jgi:hypothetical protein